MQFTPDDALVRAIAAGDRAAMQTLYGRHSARVFRFLCRLVRDQGLAEDLVSDVFFEAWRSAGKFEHRSEVSTWLLGVARNKAFSVLRKRREDTAEEGMAEAIVDDADDPEVRVQKLGKAEAIRLCVDRLSAEHREVVDLVYYHEKSVEEVAAIVGAPEATVKTRMFYARKKLAELLKAAGIERGWP
jgi:RNA polymerase sigma-70 factor, ECF subfamily